MPQGGWSARRTAARRICSALCFIGALAVALLPRMANGGGEASHSFLLSASSHGDANGDGIVNFHDEELYLFSTLSERPRRLTRNSYRERAVTLAPNGRNFVFFGDPVDTIYLADVTRGSLRAVLSTSGSMNSQQFINLNPLLRRLPWSSDGRKIFLSFAYPVNQWYALRLNGPRVDIGPATWSRRRRRYSLPPFDRRRLQQVHDVKAHGFFPSPDGKRALYIDGKRGAVSLVWLHNGKRTWLMADRFLYQTAASWAPNGRTVALYRLNHFRRYDELIVLDVVRKKILWRRGDVVRAKERWSPNSQRLAFTTHEGLGVYDFVLRRLIVHPQDGRGMWSPIWSAGSDEVFGIAGNGVRPPRIDAIQIAQGSRRNITSLPGLKRLLYRIPQP